MKAEAAANADFSAIRYAQCWEDADVLLEALNIQPGDTCLAICSAGDNALAMLTRDPARVIAVDLSRAQLACLQLRIAAYRTLTHAEFLDFLGVLDDRRPPKDAQAAPRQAAYQRCRPLLSDETRAYWDAHPQWIAQGFATVGKFENYFGLFRQWILPLIHARRTSDALLAGGNPDARAEFYDRRWNTFRWRMLFRIFFSRTIMGRFGRDPAFFKYVQGSVSERILGRARHALRELNPADNPYLQWIVAGRFTTALQLALRPEHFEKIRANLGRLEFHHTSLEEQLDRLGPRSIHRFNLSDIFEYMSPANYETLLRRIHQAAIPGGRLAYWNMLAPRSRPESMSAQLRPLADLAQRLHLADKAFFYSAFIVEEVLP